MPQGPIHLRVEAPGFETVQALSRASTEPRSCRRSRSPWIASAPFPAEWCAFPPRASSGLHAGVLTITRHLRRPRNLIDKYEVTNREFKAFVDAGGYRDRQYWEHPSKKTGAASLQDAMNDSAIKAAGRARQRGKGEPTRKARMTIRYPASAGTKPRAYTKFQGRSLPTIYHWLGGTATGQAALYCRSATWPAAAVKRVAVFSRGRGTSTAGT